MIVHCALLQRKALALMLLTVMSMLTVVCYGSKVVLVNLYLESVMERSIIFINVIPKAKRKSDLISLKGPASLESQRRRPLSRMLNFTLVSNLIVYPEDWPNHNLIHGNTWSNLCTSYGTESTL